MLWSGLLNETVTVYPMEDGATDRYGNAAKRRGTPVNLRARVEPLRSPRGDVELEDQRDTFISEYTMYTQPSDALTGTSELTWKGEDYQVIGTPKPFTGLLGPTHLETYIRRITG
jgi:hypothetical protein